MNKKEIAGELVTAVVYAALGLVLCFNPGMSIDLICTGAGWPPSPTGRSAC